MFVTWNVGGHFLGGGWPGRSSRLTACGPSRRRATSAISERLASPCHLSWHNSRILRGDVVVERALATFGQRRRLTNVRVA